MRDIRERWPEPHGDRDKAEFCSRLLTAHRIAAFSERGRAVFVAGSADLFSTVLERGRDIYTLPVHPFRDAAALYTATGRMLLGLGAAPGRAAEAIRGIERIVAEESETAAATALGDSRIPRWKVLEWSRVLCLRISVRVLFGTSAAAWTGPFAAASAFREGWLVLATNPWHHPALECFLEADELIHRAADAIIDSSPTALRVAGEDRARVRTGVIETVMNAYNGLAATLAWILIDLSRNPAWQRALVRELDLQLPDADSFPKRVSHFPLLRQTVLEALRLHPAAWAIGRFAATDAQLEGRCVPRGSLVLCSTYALHRDPLAWVQPDRFDPARFAPHADGRRRHSFAPFGLGKHACPARNVVPLILQTALAVILRRYVVTVENAAGVGNRPWIALVPHPDPAVIFDRRSV